MILLAYDTSGPQLSVALFADDDRIAQMESAPGVRHSSILLPMLDRLLKKCRQDLRDIDVLAVGVGPGSFTGLRVGVTTAKILGYVVPLKIVAVCSLEAIARERMGRQRRVAVMKDARKGQVYGAIYEKRGDRVKTVFAPALLTQEKFLAKARGASLAGEGEDFPLASGIAQAGLVLARDKRFMDPARLEPLYLYERDCNVTLAKK